MIGGWDPGKWDTLEEALESFPGKKRLLEDGVTLECLEEEDSRNGRRHLHSNPLDRRRARNSRGVQAARMRKKWTFLDGKVEAEQRTELHPAIHVPRHTDWS